MSRDDGKMTPWSWRLSRLVLLHRDARSVGRVASSSKHRGQDLQSVNYFKEHGPQLQSLRRTRCRARGDHLTRSAEDTS